jgi:hypothetical protein
VIAAIALGMPLQPAHGQLSGAYQAQNGGEVEALPGIVANPEWAVQDILARIMPPDADPIDRYQFEVNLRLADTRTFYQISKTTTYEDAAKILFTSATTAGSAGGHPDQKAIGDLDEDYVYTAVTPCRIVDTRPSQGGAGIIRGKSTRDFYVYGDGTTIGSQGGNSSGCASPRGEPRAVHINATVVPPANGFLTVYPANIAQVPAVSLLNYQAGINIANAGIIQTHHAIGPPELRVYANGDTHVIIDVLGYFHEVDAIDPSLLPVTTLFTVTSSDGSGVASTICPAGSFVTSANCDCDNANNTRNFGVLFSCLIAGNGAVAGCFPEGVTYDPFLPSPVATIQAMCAQSISAASATSAAKSADAAWGSAIQANPISSGLDASIEGPDLFKAVQSVRDQVLTHTQKLEARK